MKYSMIFAQAYGENGYGECEYSGGTAQTNCLTTAGGNTSPLERGEGAGLPAGLSGVSIILLAFVVIVSVVACIMLIGKAWRRQPVAQEVNEIEDERFESR